MTKKRADQITLVCIPTCSSEFDVYPVYALLTLTREDAFQVLRLRTVYEQVGELVTDAFALDELELHDHRITFCKRLVKDKEAADKLEAALAGGYWCVVGDGIPLPPEPDSPDGVDFDPQISRIHVCQQFVYWSAYLEEDGSPKHVTAYLTWEDLTNWIKGDKTEWLTVSVTERRAKRVKRTKKG